MAALSGWVGGSWKQPDCDSGQGEEASVDACTPYCAPQVT
jgi:hypothetical protein